MSGFRNQHVSALARRLTVVLALASIEVGRRIVARFSR